MSKNCFTPNPPRALPPADRRKSLAAANQLAAAPEAPVSADIKQRTVKP